MPNLKDVSIRYKLVAIIMIASATALIVASGALIISDQIRFRTDLADEVETLATIAAESTAAAVSLGDMDAAAKAVASLYARPHIESACVYQGSSLLAWYSRAETGGPCPSQPGPDGTYTENDILRVVKSIVLDNKRIGTIYLNSDLEEVDERLKLQIATSLLVLLGASCVALLMSSWLQNVISLPIQDLAGTMEAVSHQGEAYTIRARKFGDDELGRLVDSFNSMLAQIQERNAQLRSAKAELELRVEKRTVELRDQLDETQRARGDLERVNLELVQSNRELDDFAYVASHDLKEPLRGIHSYAGFLLEDYGDKFGLEARGRLETMMRLTRRMESLIDTLLHYSQVGRLELAYEQVDLNGVLHDILDSLRIRLTELGVEIRVPRPLPVEYCDRARVGEVFRNLIGNAMKYNDKLVKWVEIGFTESGSGNVYYVRDNGIGIPAKHQDTIFRIFKRLHARDKYGGGAGAGLTIVRKIVERHDGNVWIESTEGEGTTFFFTLSKVGTS